MRRALTTLLVFVALAALVGSCVPRNLTPECKEMRAACIADCPPTDDAMGIGGPGLLGIGDSRTKCKRRCKRVCDAPEDEAADKLDDEGIPTL